MSEDWPFGGGLVVGRAMLAGIGLVLVGMAAGIRGGHM